MTAARRLRGRVKNLCASDNGATAVEFAIVVWPLLLLTIGIVETGRLLWTRSVVEEAVTQAARCAAVRHESCATAAGALDIAKIRQFVRTLALSRSVEVEEALVTVSAATTCLGAEGFSEIAVAYNFNTVFETAFGWKEGVFPIRASACFPNPAT